MIANEDLGADGVGMLKDLRVVELGQGMPVQLAGLYLARLGADVLKIERPGGDPARGSASFAIWNRDKRSLVLDLETSAGKALLDQHLAGADVLIHQFRPSRAAQLGLDDAALAVRFPQLVVAGITGSPRNHPDVDRSDDELLVAARTGILYENDGYRAGPIVWRYRSGEMGAANLCAGAIFARLLMRFKTGKGGPAHTSVMQGHLSQIPLIWGRNSAGPMPNLAAYPPAPRAKTDQLFRCQDGGLVQVMDPTKQFDYATLPTMWEIIAEGVAIDEPGGLEEAFSRRPTEVWLKELREADLAVEVCMPMGDLFDHVEVLANEYVVAVDDPVLGRTIQPNVPIHTDAPLPPARPAPQLDQDGDRVWEVHSVPEGDGSLPAMPLEGLRVLDLGMFLAGPMGPSLIGDLGANVIKVEPITGDRLRFLHRHYQAAARSKRSIAVDLRRPEAAPILERLVRWADALHHNMRFKGADKLGLSEANIRRINPDIVFGYVSAYGQRGERGNWPGFDTIFTALAGWEFENAGEGNPPVFVKHGPMDVLSAQNCFVAMMASIYARRAYGDAWTTQCSLLGAAAFSLVEVLKGPDGRLSETYHLDSEQTGFSPYHRIFQTADNKWIAVAAHADNERQALHEVLGPDNQSFAARARQYNASDLVTALEEREVPCDHVQSEDAMNQFFDDPVNRELGLVWALSQPMYGTIEQPGCFWNFGDTPVVPRYAAPALGQHTDEIMQEIGFSASEIAGFREKKIIA